MISELILKRSKGFIFSFLLILALLAIPVNIGMFCEVNAGNEDVLINASSELQDNALQNDVYGVIEDYAVDDSGKIGQLGNYSLELSNENPGVELMEKRTLRARYFQKDETVTAYLTSTPTCFQDAEDRWHDIERKLSTPTGTDYLGCNWHGDVLEIDNDALNPYLWNFQTSVDGYYSLCVGQDLDPIINDRYYRAFAQWDTSGIPDGAPVTDVDLSIYVGSSIDAFIGDYVDSYTCDMDIYQMSYRPSDWGRQSGATVGSTLFNDAGDGTLYTYSFITQGQGWTDIDLGSNADFDLENQLGSNWFAVGFHEYTENEDGSGTDRGISFLYADLTVTYEEPPPGPCEYDEYFYSVGFTPFDNDGDGYDDAVEVSMDVDTSYGGSLGVDVDAYLVDPSGFDADSDFPGWTITSTSVEWGYAYLYVPAGSPEGWYDVELYLYDECGNYEDYSLGTDVVYLYPPGGPCGYDEYFYSVGFTPFDNDGDGYDDAVEVSMDVDTSYGGSLGVDVDAYLVDPSGSIVDSDFPGWTITSTSVEWGYAYLYVPAGSPEGCYSVELYLYDECGNYEDYSLGTDVICISYPVTGWFWDAWLEDPVDNDGDGYYGNVSLCWDADTNIAELSVYVDMWSRFETGYEAYLGRAGPYMIYGAAADTFSVVVSDGSTGLWDFKLELYDASSDALLDVLDYEEDPDITDVPMDEDDQTPQIKDWTFMVYLDGDNNLEWYGIQIFLDMASVGSTADVNIVVQMDRIPGEDDRYDDWTDCMRFYVEPGTTPSIAEAVEDLDEVNMGDPNTLSAFVNWATTNYPAEKYCLVLYDHGSGAVQAMSEGPATTGVCFDDTDGDVLTLPELTTAFSATSNMDVIFFDACSMGMIEVAYQIKDYADVMVGSEEVGWTPGPYDDYMTSLTGNPTMTPSDLATHIVNHYIPWAPSPSTMSAIDLSQISTLATSTSNFASLLMSEEATYHTEIHQAMLDADGYQGPYLGFYGYYIDLYNFAELIYAYISDTAIRTLANEVMTGVDNAVIISGENSHPDSHGLSTFFPDDSSKYYTFEAAYLNTAYAANTQWDEFVENHLTYTPDPCSYNENFYSIIYTPFDNDGDGYDDAVEVPMDVDTMYGGSIGVCVDAYLIDPSGSIVDVDYPCWTITSTSVEWGYAYLYVPAGSPEGLYSVELYLYDECENPEDYSLATDVAYLYPPDIPDPCSYDEYFGSVGYTTFDSDGDGYNDTAEVSMDVDTTYGGSLGVFVNAYLIAPNGSVVDSDHPGWTITAAAVEWGYAYLYVPAGSPEGLYSVELYLYDECENPEDYSLGSDVVYLYPPVVPIISVINPDTGNSSFMFSTDTASVGTRFNATVWVTEVADLFAYQVDMTIDDTLLNITNAWHPTWDPDWVFYGHSVLPLGPSFEDADGDGVFEAVLIADVLYGQDSATGAGLLTIIEFEIISVPLSGSDSCALDIDSDETLLIEEETQATIPSTKTNGYYEIVSVDGAWDVGLIATIDIYNDESTLGVRADATDGFDAAYDEVDPPAPPSGVVSYFYYPDNPTSPVNLQKLSTSIIPPTPMPRSWTYMVHPIGVSGLVTINWSASAIANIPAEYPVYLHCPDGSAIDMRTTTEYSFTGEDCTTYTFTITVGEVCFDLELLAGWNMISFPVIPQDPNFSDIFENLTYYQVITWDGFSYIPAIIAEPGVGYWVLVLEPVTVAVCGVPVESYERDLPAGWSMIGSIYPCTVNASCVFPSFHQLLTWDGTSYVTSTTIEPGKGYWALVLEPTHIIVNESCCTVAQSHASTEGLIEVQSTTPTWAVALTASVDIYSDDSTFGVRSDATDGFDGAYDEVDPPAPPSGVASYFYYPDNPTSPVNLQKLSTSIIPPADIMNWTYILRPVAVSGEACINWSASEIAAIPAEYAVQLVCPGDIIIDMRTNTEYCFAASADTSYTFTVQVGLRAYLVVQGLDNRIYYRTYNPLGDSWGDWAVLPGATCDSPAAAVFQGKLHVVVRGMDEQTIWHGSVDLATESFSGWTLIDGTTPSAPYLTANATTLCLTVRGGNNRIYYSCYVEDSWSSWSVVPTGTTSDTPVAALLDSELHIVVRGIDELSLWHIIMHCDGGVIRDWIQLEGTTPSRPSLTASQNTNELYLTVQGTNNRIYYCAYNGSADTWGSWNALPTGATCDSPATTVIDDTLHIVVRGMDEQSLWFVTVDLTTSTPSDWQHVNGTTNSAVTLTSGVWLQ